MLGKSALLLLISFVPAVAQMPLTRETERTLPRLFESASKGDALHCHVETFKPFLDFAFRYEVGYLLQCPLAQFDGKPTALGTIVRVQPEGAGPTSLGQSFVIPEIPAPEKKHIDLRRLHQEIEFSGVFAIGEGAYQVDLVVFDEHDRSYRKSWRAKASPHGSESEAPLAIAPGTVAAISLPPWQGTSDDGAGLHVTVLLDAAPMNPYSSKLRAWDRAFLLGALSSVLRQLPLASVRVSAFNLDQQQELFREEDFDHTALGRLAGALSKLELGTVSARVLGQQNGWADLLTRLVRTEAVREQPSDAVIFIGPTSRIGQKLPEFLDVKGGADLPFFYFEYYPQLGRDFPDSIEHITDGRGGTTFKLHSPGDLARAIRKMQKQLREQGAFARVTQ